MALMPAALGTDGLGDGGPASMARLADPDGVTFNPAGDMLVADFGDNRIRAVRGAMPRGQA